MTDENLPPDDAVSRRDLSVDMGRATIYGPGLMLPISLACYLAFHYFWGWKAVSQGWKEFLHPLSFLLALVIGTVVHELIHAIGWVSFGKKPWRVIKFGFMAAALAPYAHCKEPLEVGAYRWGAALPGLLVGIAPMLVAVVVGSGWLLFFGVFFTIAAGGDALVLWLIRGVRRGALVEDHATRAGCIVLDVPLARPQDEPLNVG